MISSNCFMSSSFCPCPCPCIICSNAARLATSHSETIVQYRSPEKSVITRLLPIPSFSLSADILRNFSTIGRTFPGLQWKTSRISSISVSRSIEFENALKTLSEIVAFSGPVGAALQASPLSHGAREHAVQGIRKRLLLARSIRGVAARLDSRAAEAVHEIPHGEA